MTILYFIFRKRNRLGHQSWVILLLRFPYIKAKSRAEQRQPPYWSAIFQMTFLPFFALTANCTLSPTQQKLIQSVIVLILSLFSPIFKTNVLWINEQDTWNYFCDLTPVSQNDIWSLCSDLFWTFLYSVFWLEFSPRSWRQFLF